MTEALQAFREAGKPTTPPAEGTKPDRSAVDAAMAKSLAESLGVDESKVTAALEEIRAAAQAGRAGCPENQAGHCRQRRNSHPNRGQPVTKAVEKGVIGGGGRQVLLTV